jgi:Putative prokaryotic signal transducing protein
MKLKILKQARSLTYLLDLKHELESAGIVCFVNDGVSMQIIQRLSGFPAILKVAEQDFERARKIMLETEGTVTAEGCPQCGSKRGRVRLSPLNYIRMQFGLLKAIITFKPMISIFKDLDFKCAECGTVYNNRRL